MTSSLFNSKLRTKRFLRKLYLPISAFPPSKFDFYGSFWPLVCSLFFSESVWMGLPHVFPLLRTPRRRGFWPFSILLLLMSVSKQYVCKKPVFQQERFLHWARRLKKLDGTFAVVTSQIHGAFKVGQLVFDSRLAESQFLPANNSQSAWELPEEFRHHPNFAWWPGSPSTTEGQESFYCIVICLRGQPLRMSVKICCLPFLTLSSTPVLLTGYFELSGQGNGLIVRPSLEQLYSSLPVEATFSALSGHVWGLHVLQSSIFGWLT